MLAKCIFIGRDREAVARHLGCSYRPDHECRRGSVFSAPAINKRLMGERKRWSGAMSILHLFPPNIQTLA
jgi:hypothetical protein